MQRGLKRTTREKSVQARGQSLSIDYTNAKVSPCLVLRINNWTYRVCREELVMVDGNPPANCPFLTKVKDAIFFNELKKPSGRAFIPVDSRWSVERPVKLRNDPGSEPPIQLLSEEDGREEYGYIPGTCPFPIAVKLCNPTKLPNAEGIEAGTPGNVRELSYKLCHYMSISCISLILT